jgi:peptidoglycan/xylan/chitin deacetylase (PgdA/CDA1 family)
MKQAVLKLMVAAGAFVPFRLVNRAKTVVITYHRFSELESATRTSARTFAAQLDYLGAHYTIVPLSLIAAHLTRGVELPRRVAAMTIDDGYRDAYDIAFPILRQRRMPATVFVVTDFIDRKAWMWPDKVRFLALNTPMKQIAAPVAGDQLCLELSDRRARLAAADRVNAVLKRLPNKAKEEAIARLALTLDLPLPELPPADFGPLTWEQAREMMAGQIEFGSHTVTHPILTRVDDAQLWHELGASRSRIEAVLGKRADLFCYPNGDVDARVLRTAERAGYQCAVTTRHGLNDGTVHPLDLRRIDAERDLAHFVQSVSGFEQVKNKFRRARAVVSGKGAYECQPMA